MGKLIKEGKIRGYGFCNDNCYGLTKAALLARHMGVPPPVCLQGDYSLIDRKRCGFSAFKLTAAPGCMSVCISLSVCLLNYTCLRCLSVATRTASPKHPAL